MDTTLKSHHRALGKTGLRVSPLGLGTVKFGRNEQVKYPTAFDLPDEDALADLLALAKSLGINLLDTAPAYGLSEQRLGRLLAGQRGDWVIVGKAGEQFTDGQSYYDFSPDAIRRSVEQSLRDLQTDYLDVLLLHATDGDLALCHDDALHRVLFDMKSSGMVRAVGLSAKSVAAGVAGAAIFDVMMIAYGLAYDETRPALDAAAAHGAGVLLKKVLNSGHAVREARGEGSEERDLVYESLRFAFDHPAVHAAIVGTINPDHLRANVAACSKCFT